MHEITKLQFWLLAVPALCSVQLERARDCAWCLSGWNSWRRQTLLLLPPAPVSALQEDSLVPPPHLHLSFLLTLFRPIPPPKAVSFSFMCIMNILQVFVFFSYDLLNPVCDILYFVLDVMQISCLFTLFSSYFFLSINPSKFPPPHSSLSYPLHHRHWHVAHTHLHTHRFIHTVSGRQTSGLQGEPSSPPLTVWICHLLLYHPHPSPFPWELSILNRLLGCRVDGGMTNWTLGLEAAWGRRECEWTAGGLRSHPTVR